MAGQANSRSGRAAAADCPRRLERQQIEDVTTAAQFDALNEAVAAVTPSGLVTAKDPARRTS